MVPRIQADAARRLAKLSVGHFAPPAVSRDTADLLVAAYDRLRELCTPAALGALAAAIPETATSALQLPQQQLAVGARARPLVGAPATVSAYLAASAMRSSAELIALYAPAQVGL